MLCIKNSVSQNPSNCVLLSSSKKFGEANIELNVKVSFALSLLTVEIKSLVDGHAFSVNAHGVPRVSSTDGNE